VTTARHCKTFRKRSDNPLWDQIECLYLDGKKRREITALIGVDNATITRVARARGLPLRYGGRRVLHRSMWPFIVAWAKAGKSEQEIKEGMGYRL
jgi:hypothetical protein